MTGVDQNQLFAAIRERDEAWAEVARLQRIVAGVAISNSASGGPVNRDDSPHLQLVKTNIGAWYQCAKRFFDAGNYRDCLRACEGGLDTMFGVPRFMSIGDPLRELQDRARICLSGAALPQDAAGWIEFIDRHYTAAADEPQICKHCSQEFDGTVSVIGLWLHIDSCHHSRLRDSATGSSSGISALVAPNPTSGDCNGQSPVV